MSWLLGNSGTTEKVHLESQGLEDDDYGDENYDKFGYSCHSTHPPPQCKSRDSSGDNQVEDLGEPIPFSLNPRHSYTMKDKGLKNRIYAKSLAKHALELEEEAQELQEPFYKDMEMPVSLSKDEDHSWTYRLPVHQRLRALRIASTTPSGSCDSFQRSADEDLGMDAFAPCAHASDPYLEHPECTKGGEPHMLHEEAIRDTEFPSTQLTYSVLRKENTMLWKVVRSMQSSLESQVHTVWRLERQVKASLAKEEREAQELQSFVQQTEQTLQLMTQRALEAESNVEKLKQEISILQGELESFRVENKNLRAGQTTSPGATKHNIDFALQNLHRITAGVNLSIRQLASGAESLHLVAEVLKSTGKISEVEAEQRAMN